MIGQRVSIQPTYDSRETGPRYYVSAFVHGRAVTWRKPIDDPFVTTTVTVGWPDLLRALLRRRLLVRFQVDADRDLIEDVLELDGNHLGINCTRRAEFHGQLFKALDDRDGDPE